MPAGAAINQQATSVFALALGTKKDLAFGIFGHPSFIIIIIIIIIDIDIVIVAFWTRDSWVYSGSLVRKGTSE